MKPKAGFPMHYPAHTIIYNAAIEALPQEMRRRFAFSKETLGVFANYPDLFDDPGRPRTEKSKIDPDFERYAIYRNPDFPRLMFRLHAAAGSPLRQQERIWLYVHFYRSMSDAAARGDFADLAKTGGCLSHLIGDTLQLAHLFPEYPDDECIRRLLPPPALPEFSHPGGIHTQLEAVIGKCGVLRPEDPFGETVHEAAWHTALRLHEAAEKFQALVIPAVQALYAKDSDRLERIVSEPLTRSAELTRDALVTVFRIGKIR